MVALIKGCGRLPVWFGQDTERERIVPVLASKLLDIKSLFNECPDIYQLLGSIQGIDVCEMSVPDAARTITEQLIPIDMTMNQTVDSDKHTQSLSRI